MHAQPDLQRLRDRLGSTVQLRTWRLVVFGLATLLCLSCGGGGGGGTYIPPPAPSIQSFSANPGTVTAGRQTILSAVYSNGQGVVTPGSIYMPSGYNASGVYVRQATTFTLTVTNPAGVAVTATTPVQVTVPPVGFQPTGNMVVSRSHPSATLLQDGRVLIVGGTAAYGFFYAAEVYNPATNAFTSIGPTLPMTSGQSATRLQDGRVLIVGGGSGSFIDDVEQPLGSTLIFDPTAGTFSGGPVLGTARSYHTATLLPNGQVLIAGGLGLQDGTLVPLSTAELYDPGTKAFQSTGSMINARSGFSSGFTATLLPEGEVLVAGDDSATTTAELYNPATGLFTSTGSMTVSRRNLSATVLGNGQVLVEGLGTNQAGSADLYNPATGSFSEVSSFAAVVGSHTATLLPDGTVLLAGGGTDGGPYNAGSSYAWIYDPATGSLQDTGSLNFPRVFLTATLLANGKVLVAGGQTSYTATPAELYGFTTP